MITISGNIANFEGTAKQLTLEFTHCILGFKYNLMKEFGLSENEVKEIIGKCGEIAFMSNKERQEYLNMLLGEDEK